MRAGNGNYFPASLVAELAELRPATRQHHDNDFQPRWGRAARQWRPKFSDNNDDSTPKQTQQRENEIAPWMEITRPTQTPSTRDTTTSDMKPQELFPDSDVEEDLCDCIACGRHDRATSNIQMQMALNYHGRVLKQIHRRLDQLDKRDAMSLYPPPGLLTTTTAAEEPLSPAHAEEPTTMTNPDELTSPASAKEPTTTTDAAEELTSPAREEEPTTTND